MPKAKPSFKRADVRAAWQLMKDLGETPVKISYRPDGSFRITCASGLQEMFEVENVNGHPVDNPDHNPLDRVFTKS